MLTDEAAEAASDAEELVDSGDAATPLGEHGNARASGAASSASAHRAPDIGPLCNLAETTTIYLSI